MRRWLIALTAVLVAALYFFSSYQQRLQIARVEHGFA